MASDGGFKNIWDGLVCTQQSPQLWSHWDRHVDQHICERETYAAELDRSVQYNEQICPKC